MSSAREPGPAAPTSSGESEARTETPGKVYTEEEVVQRLRGQATEIERLRKIADEFESAKRQTEEQRRKQAEERGQYQQLYDAEKARALALEARMAEMESAVKEHETRVAEAIRQRVAGISVDAVRAQVEDLLRARSLVDQQRILDVFLAAQQTAPPPRQGGAPATAPESHEIDSRRFLSDRSYRVNQALDHIRRARGA